MKADFVSDVIDCARCDENHSDLQFFKMEKPMAPKDLTDVEWTHFATCPVTGCPIMGATK